MDDVKKEVRKIPSLLNVSVQQIEIDVPQAEKHYWNFCVHCGTQLDSRKCKLFCPSCGFYHNCSEP